MWWGQGTEPPDDLKQDNPQNVDMKDLQDQFEQQQTLIAQLKEMLRKNEQQLVTKEKEVEEYATKLSSIKSRASRRGRGKLEKTVSTEKAEEDQSSQEPSKEKDTGAEGKLSGKRNVQRGNLILLRKQLEENRIKCEQRSKEVTENKRGIEEMVENLRSQLEEREQTIQELKGEFGAKLSVASSTLNTSRIDATHSLEIPEGGLSEQQIQELFMQLTIKDNKVTEMTNKIIELENNILDLQENLREKDSVIEARTKAITLMSEDLSKKTKATLDTLDETREEMRMMQQNFIALETNMRREKEDLIKQLELREKRLFQLEETNKTLESTRFDLSTRNAELQEKIVHIQSELQKVNESQQDVNDSNKNAEMQKLKQALDDSNKQILHLKALLKNKEPHENEDILQLQQRIAELEEDKGAELMWKEQVSELEGRVKQQSQDLDSHLHALSLIEKEKLDLLQGLQDKTLIIANLERTVGDLKQRISDIENSKVTVEMKAVELEEQFDALLTEKTELSKELELLKTVNRDSEQIIVEKDVQVALNTVFAQQEKWGTQDMSEKQEKDSSNLELSLKPLESELEDHRNLVYEQRSIISDLNEKLKLREEEIELQSQIIAKLELLGDKAREREERDEDGNKISEIVKELGEMAGDLNEWKNRCSEVEDRLERLENEKIDLQKRLEELINENELINSQLKFQKEVAEDLAEKLNEKNKSLAVQNKELNSLQLIITEKNQALEDQGVALFEVSEKFKRLDQDLSLRYEELESKLGLKEEELKRVKEEILQLESSFNYKSIELNNVNVSVEKLCLQLDDFLHKSGYLVAETGSSNIHRLEFAVSFLIHKCIEQNSEINTLNGTIEDLRLKLSEANYIHAELQKEMDILKTKEEEFSSIKDEYNQKKQETDQRNGEFEELQTRLDEQMIKNKKLAKLLKAKALLVRNYEEKEKEFQAAIQIKEQEIGLIKTESNSLKIHLENEISVLKKCLEENNSVIENYAIKCSALEKELQLQVHHGDEVEQLSKKCLDFQQQLELITKEKECLEDRIVELNTQIAKQETEISMLRLDLQKWKEDIDTLTTDKNSEIETLKEENKTLTEEWKELEEKYLKIISTVSLKDSEIAANLSTIENISQKSLENDQVISELRSKLHDLSALENSVMKKNERIFDLEEQLQNLSDSRYFSVSAMEAKLQEKEAYIESLEQDLLKSKEKILTLEDRIYTMDERRKSLEVKFESLGEMLLEADRKKEEVEENEEILEGRLSNLIKSIEAFKKRLQETDNDNRNLSKKIEELKEENESFRRTISSSEMTVKNLQKEIERLSPFESSYSLAFERIESLETEMKRRTVEFECCMKNKIEESKHYADNLESDLRNLSKQLESCENDKRVLAEQCEKLNDTKVNLEEEIETLNENLRLCNLRIIELEREMKQPKFVTGGMSIEDGNTVQPSVLEENTTSVTCSKLDASATKEDLLDSPDYEEVIKQLLSDLEKMKCLLSQKDSEIQSYQSRLLQIQFGQNKTTDDFNIKDVQKSNTNDTLAHLETELKNSRQIVEELQNRIKVSDDVIKNKDTQLLEQTIIISELSNSVREMSQLKQQCSDYQTRISTLEMDNRKIYEEFVRLVAEHEVSDIISRTVQLVEMKDFIWKQKSEVEFTTNQLVAESRNEKEYISDASRNLILEETLKILELEMSAVKSERDELIAKLQSVLQHSSSPGLLLHESPCPVGKCTCENFDEGSTVQEKTLEHASLVESLTSSQSVAIDIYNPQLEVVDTIDQLDDDDGWGWGSNDARLEEEHMLKQQEIVQTVNSDTDLKSKIIDLESQVEESEKEKARLIEELHEAQVRNGKLLKRLKDFKLKNEKLMRENQELALKTAEGYCGLDSAIEDELKIRIDLLEKELRESNNERDILKQEKESLLCRIDVLTSANEKFLEMKEKQDLEMEVREFKNKELANQIEGLNWRISELMEEKFSNETFQKPMVHQLESSDNPTVDELLQQISALAADNEHLQILLEEQRALRLQAENALISDENVTSAVDNSLNDAEKLKLEYEKLKENYEVACRQLDQLTTTEQNYLTLETEYRKCLEKVVELEETKAALNSHIDQMESEMNCKNMMELEEKQNFSKIKDELNNRIEELIKENLSLHNQYSQLSNDRSELFNEYHRVESDLEMLKSENMLLMSKVSAQESENEVNIKSLYKDINTFNLPVELSEESVKNDSRGTDVDTYKHKHTVSVQTECNQQVLTELENETKKLLEQLKQKSAELKNLQQILDNQQINQFVLKDEFNRDTEIPSFGVRDKEILFEEAKQQIVNRDLEQRKYELDTVKKNYEDVLSVKQQKINQLQEILEKGEQETDIRIQNLESLITAKESLIADLKMQLCEMEDKYKEELYNRNQDIENMRVQIYESEREMENLICAKEEDIQNLRIMLTEKERNSSELLQTKETDIENMKIKINEKDSRIKELSDKLSFQMDKISDLEETVAALELELCNLKKQLSVTSADLSSGVMKRTIDNEIEEKPEKATEGQKNELDVALYMLHQRDVRCDELTLELMKLLEERDTLQLRLSNALRINEELRSKLGRSSVDSSMAPSESVFPVADNVTQFNQVEQTVAPGEPQSSTSLFQAQEPSEDLKRLAEKLSQLHSVDYRRDVTLRDENEQRHSEQVQILQQRGGIVVDASYTLSRDVQSPSTVLLNWIRGRSTPKVMHI